MLISDAYDIIGDLIAPVTVGEFFDEIVGKRFCKIPASPESSRTAVLGADPEAAILQAFPTLAPKITSHAAAPLGPPPVSEPVPGEREFLAKIRAFHALGYTVRLPELRAITPNLSRLMRALETVLHQPVEVAAFWSRGDARAPIHHDDQDIIVIQLKGQKTWYISTDPSELPNDWKSIPKGPPQLDRSQAVEVGPGDLLYLPRGTTHRVDALSDSLHVSIGFTPLTLREALIAMIDHLSDLDRPLREGAGNHLALASRRDDFSDLPSRIRTAAARLQEACRSDAFIGESMQRRSSKAIAKLGKLSAPGPDPVLSGAAVLRRNPLSTHHIMANERMLDLSYPGGHLYIHRGVQQSVLFIAETPQFRIADIPGDLADDVRIALVRRFLEVGFLQVVQPDDPVTLPEKQATLASR